MNPETTMPTITTNDGTTIFFKDWGSKAAPPLVFHHGWPLSGDDWDTQMLYFLEKGYRVIAHDRRGHGRSSQVSDGHDMDHYAADVAAVTSHLDLRNAVHVGHSTGGGEALHYAARHGDGRVAKLVLIGAVPPIMVKTAANPGGLPIEVFDGLRQQLATNRAQFYRDFAGGPFYGYNRPGAKVSQAVVDNWWRQGMMGGAKAHYDGIKAFSETDFTDDLKSIDVPTYILAVRSSDAYSAATRRNANRERTVALDEERLGDREGPPRGRSAVDHHARNDRRLPGQAEPRCGQQPHGQHVRGGTAQGL
jgi:non-heme chloroperoxidase